MQFTILSPSDTQKFSVAWLNVNSNQGNFVIQEGHAPMIIAIPAQEITLGIHQDDENLVQESVKKKIKVSEGILEISRNKVVLLVSESI